MFCWLFRLLAFQILAISNNLEFSLHIHFRRKVLFFASLVWFWLSFSPPSPIDLWFEVASTLLSDPLVWCRGFKWYLGVPVWFWGRYCWSGVEGGSMKLILFWAVRMFSPCAHLGFIKTWLLEMSQKSLFFSIFFLEWGGLIEAEPWLCPLPSHTEVFEIPHHTGSMHWPPASVLYLEHNNLSRSLITALSFGLLSDSWKWLSSFLSLAVTYPI